MDADEATNDNVMRFDLAGPEPEPRPHSKFSLRGLKDMVVKAFRWVKRGLVYLFCPCVFGQIRRREARKRMAINRRAEELARERDTGLYTIHFRIEALR